jgi:hypothetical protein
MYTYKQIYSDSIAKTISTNHVLRSDNAVIPFDPDNTDYQNYLKWLAKGNTLLPAENT